MVEKVVWESSPRHKNRTSYPLFAIRTFRIFQGEFQEAHFPGGEARPYPLGWPRHPYTIGQRKRTRGLTWWGGEIFVYKSKLQVGEKPLVNYKGMGMRRCQRKSACAKEDE